MSNILIVEDDELLSRGITFALEKENLQVSTAYSYQDGFSAYLSQNFDLILLDINLPDQSGTRLCSEIRENSAVPIIFITANDTEPDIIAGFKLGCDDYIAKPFSIDVLKQRIAAVLRRSGGDDQSIWSWGDITIDFRLMKVKKAGQSIKLTATEYKLLELLAKNHGQVLTRQLLLEKLWDADGNFVDENALSVNIRRLRRKLENDPKNPMYIVTVFGIGYTWGN